MEARREVNPQLSLKQVDRLCEVSYADVRCERWVLTLQHQKHLPGYAAIAEMARGTGAQFRDVLGLSEVHLEQAANAGG